MPRITISLPKTIAVVRILTSVFFLLFGQYKLLGPEFAHGGFQQYPQGFIQEGAVSFYQPFLSDLILPHAVFFGYMVGVVEMFIGISLLLGFWVRFASVLGILHMLSLTLATWWQPGRGMPVWPNFHRSGGGRAAPWPNRYSRRQAARSEGRKNGGRSGHRYRRRQDCQRWSDGAGATLNKRPPHRSS